jgi:formate hydrogenlyase subunit 6/NADH:ubiquinone oxidoreductase subunit I
MCAKHCPANAIVVDKAQGLWRIDRFACVICGACVRVCPVKCLAMSNERPKAIDFSDIAGRTHEHRREAPREAAPAADGDSKAPIGKSAGRGETSGA